MICKKRVISLIFILTLFFTSIFTCQFLAEGADTAKFVSVVACQWFTIALKDDG